MAQVNNRVKKATVIVVIALLAVATVSAQAMAPAPAPSPTTGVGYSLPASGVMIGTSLLISMVALLRN
ncbi:hypothetical protein CTI12_AA168630 [Artemisia annua]|uniref:Uncharacterized protein n=1 Tax=Artemisia annua TaxID=35608 RepID=A0A2U1PCG7_ARTAN|nr:hypothetical protein CTI12_AA168630 [Artemisia annua]